MASHVPTQSREYKENRPANLSVRGAVWVLTVSVFARDVDVGFVFGQEKLFAGNRGDEVGRVAGVFRVDLLNDGGRQELRSSTGFHFQRDIRGWSLGGLTRRASSATIIGHNEISPLPDMKFDFQIEFRER